MISNFIPVRIMDCDSSGYSVATPSTGHHRVSLFELAARDTLLLQVEFVQPKHAESVAPRIESVLIDVATGRRLSTSFEYPSFATANNMIALTIQNSPYARTTLCGLRTW